MSKPTLCLTCLRIRQGLCDGEKGQTACQWYKRMTNADRIRAMTDEELADEMMCHFQNLFNCQICGEVEKCIAAARGTSKDIVRYQHCRSKHLDWLKQEVKE